MPEHLDLSISAEGDATRLMQPRGMLKPVAPFAARRVKRESPRRVLALERVLESN
jgi:hypothetical protein